MIYSAALSAALLLFAPLMLGAVQGWAVGVIFLLVLAAAASSLLGRHGTQFIQATPLDKPIAVLFVLTAFSCLFSAHRWASGVASGQLLTCVLFYYTVLHINQTRAGLIFLLYWIISVTTTLCLIGIARRSGINLILWLDFLGGQPESPQNWLIATFGNHNHMAGWLEMSFPLLLCLPLFGCQREWLPVQLLLLLLQGICLILTFSRGGWASATVSLIFIIGWLLAERSRQRGQIILLFSLAAATVGIPLLASPLVAQRLYEAELAERMLAWRGTLDMIMANWLTGTGLGTYTVAFAQFQPPGTTARYDMAHNDYLQFTAELGIGLPLLIVWMGITLYRHGLRKMKTSSSRLTKATTLGSLAGIAAIIVHSVSDFNLHIPANALLFSTLAAFVVRKER